MANKVQAFRICDIYICFSESVFPFYDSFYEFVSSNAKYQVLSHPVPVVYGLIAETTASPDILKLVSVLDHCLPLGCCLHTRIWSASLDQFLDSAASSVAPHLPSLVSNLALKTYIVSITFVA